MADETETIPVTRIAKLSLQEQVASGGATHRFTIDKADYTWAGTGATDTVTTTLMTTTTDFLVDTAFANVTTAFTGTAGTLTVMVGTDGDPNNFIAATDCKTAGPIAPVVGADPVTAAGTHAAAADVLTCRFTSGTTGNPADVTAGVVDIYLGVRDCNALG